MKRGSTVDLNPQSMVDSAGRGILRTLGMAVVGVIAFFLSFVLLWWNEGNIVAEKQAFTEMGEVFVTADASSPSDAMNGKLIYATGKLSSTDRISDALFLKAGNWLILDRRVEMYQWHERPSDSDNGGYNYSLEWGDDRIDSASFNNASGHNNPSLPIKSSTTKVASASFGAFNGLDVLEHIGDRSPLGLKPELLSTRKKSELGKLDLPVLDGDYIYLTRSDGSLASPQLGDIRVSYEVLRQGTFSLLANQVSTDSLESYVAKNGKVNFLVESGRKPAAVLLQNALDSEKNLALILRIVGFAMMWGGVLLAMGPITGVMDFIPILGGFGRMFLFLFSGVACTLLSGATILLGMIFYNPIALAIFLLALAAGGYLVFQHFRKKQTDTAMTKPPTPSRPPQAA